MHMAVINSASSGQLVIPLPLFTEREQRQYNKQHILHHFITLSQITEFIDLTCVCQYSLPDKCTVSGCVAELCIHQSPILGIKEIFALWLLSCIINYLLLSRQKLASSLSVSSEVWAKNYVLLSKSVIALVLQYK